MNIEDQTLKRDFLQVFFCLLQEFGSILKNRIKFCRIEYLHMWYLRAMHDK